jgi:hypothetical protein
MRVPEFHDEVLLWRDDEISYPEKISPEEMISEDTLE